MKHFKILTFGLLIILLISCEKNEKLEFGETQTNFKIDSIYKTTSDGFLYVKFISNGLTWNTNVVIISDKTSNPIDTIGRIDYFGSITLPIQKNNYWIVKTTGYIEKIDISWTPLE